MAAESENRFASYTRSTAFALSLSSAMVQDLLNLDLDRVLVEAFPWMRDRWSVNFGGPDSMVGWVSPTSLALERRGLLEHVSAPPPVMRFETLRLTEAGRLMVPVLHAAGFEAERHSARLVHRHPDDRIPMSLDGTDPGPTPRDRRLDAHPSLWRWCSGLNVAEGVPA